MSDRLAAQHQNQRLRVIRWFPAILAAWLGALGTLTGRAGQTTFTNLFAAPVQAWKIDLAPAAVRSLDADPRQWVAGTVTVGDRVFDKVAIHLKGSAGSFRDIHSNPGLTLNFAKLKPGRTCFGLVKLHLNNSVQDPSRMSEILCGELHRRAGVPAPRAAHALVSLNGRPLGVYVLREGFDKPFLQAAFGSTAGNLYDGGFLQDVDQDLHRASGQGEINYADLRLLRAAIATRDPKERLRQFRAILDLERFISYTAVQIITDDWDGYARNRNNYRIYHDPSSGRLVFMPHGMDQMFWQPRSSMRPNFEGQVARFLFSAPGMQAQLDDRLARLMAETITVAVVTSTIQGALARVEPALKDRPDDLRNLKFHAGEFQAKVLDRIRFLQEGVLGSSTGSRH